jgi:ABC-type transport system involved in Fe-S cluster assembly fused permease/ATPase subunit
LQAAFRRVSSDVFGHLLDLDLHFHVHRKTGQIMRILDRGTSSIQVRGTALRARRL